MKRLEKLNYNIMLIGFMGVGKSTISARLVELLSMESVEMDGLIVEKQGMAIPDIFEQYGEEYFRDLETQTIMELQGKTGQLISCGGGAVLREENVRLMKKGGLIVLLTASPETVYERVKDSRERPILNQNMSVAYIEELMEKRRPKYMAAADLIINTDGKDVDTICGELIDKLEGAGVMVEERSR